METSMAAMCVDNDWRHNKNALECHEYMFRNGEICDVWFVVGPQRNQERIGAHKYMLSARSHVFYMMFHGPNQQQGDILVREIDPVIFKKMLCYIYSENISIGSLQAYSLRYAAERYNLQGLVNRCKENVDPLSATNACDLLNIAMQNKDAAAKAHFLKFICHHTKDVFESSGFLALQRSCLEMILSQPESELPEKEIFEYALKWAKSVCQRNNWDPEDGKDLKRALSQSVLDNIRFPHMDKAYFVDYVSFLGILSTNQCLQITRFFSSDRAIPTKEPRIKRVAFDRFKRTVTCKSYPRALADALNFTVNSELLLQEILIYGSCLGPGKYDVRLEIRENGKTVQEIKEFVETDGFIRYYSIRLKAPVAVIPGNKYTLYMQMKGPPSYYGIDGINPSYSNGMKVEFRTNREGGNGTTEKMGQFPGLIFEEMQ